jgi:hypothetical protein
MVDIHDMNAQYVQCWENKLSFFFSFFLDSIASLRNFTELQLKTGEYDKKTEVSDKLDCIPGGVPSGPPSCPLYQKV